MGLRRNEDGELSLSDTQKFLESTIESVELSEIEEFRIYTQRYLQGQGLISDQVDRDQEITRTFFTRGVSMIGSPALKIVCRNARFPRHRLGEEGVLEKEAEPMCGGLAWLPKRKH